MYIHVIYYIIYIYIIYYIIYIYNLIWLSWEHDDEPKMSHNLSEKIHMRVEASRRWEWMRNDGNGGCWDD